MANEFWNVELGSGLGPVLFGMSRAEVARCLQNEGIQSGIQPHDGPPKVHLAAIGTTLVFSSSIPERLIRLDISDPRFSFATWDVIGKPIHKVVRLFKCPPDQTLWCDFYEPDEQARFAHQHEPLPPSNDADLLRSGTLWLTSQGLGCSIRAGRVVEVHLCEQDSTPRIGNGTWNRPQQVMSETGRIPQRRNRATVQPSRKINFALRAALLVALGSLAAYAIMVQLRWSAISDTQATVVAVDPPPPAPFGNTFDLRYYDATGAEHRATLERMQFYDEPKFGQTVAVRFLPEASDQPLGPRRWGGVGIDAAIPYCLLILAVYAVLQGITWAIWEFQNLRGRFRNSA